MSCRNISITGRSASGVKLMNLGEEETVVSFTKVTQGDDTFDESGDIPGDAETGVDSDNASEDA